MKYLINIWYELFYEICMAFVTKFDKDFHSIDSFRTASLSAK